MKTPSDLNECQYPKLVRDYMPLIITREGATPIFRYISGAEKKSALIDKLREESAELISAIESGDIVSITSEFADLFEVLKALVCETGTYMSAVNDYQAQKLGSKGGFSKGVYMEGVELNE